LTSTGNIIELRRSGNLQVSITISERINEWKAKAIPLHFEVESHYE